MTFSNSKIFEGRNAEQFTIVGKLGQETNIIMCNDSSIGLYAFNNEMQLVRNVDLGINTKAESFQPVLQNNQIGLFYALQDKKINGIYYKSCEPIAPTLLEPIIRLPYNATASKWVVSENKKIYLCYTAFKRSGQDSILFHSFSMDGKMISTQAIELEKAIDFNNFQVFLGNDSTILMEMTKRRFNSKIIDNIDLFIFREKQLKKKTLEKKSSEDTFVGDAFFSINNQQQCLEMYSLNIGRSKSDPSVFAKAMYFWRDDSYIDTTNAVLSLKSIRNFDMESLEKYKIESIIPLSDGGKIVLAEYQDTSESYIAIEPTLGLASSQFRNTRTISKTYHNDILVFKLDAIFNIVSTAVLYKNQNLEAEESDYLGFCLMKQREKLIAIHNDVERWGDIRFMELSNNFSSKYVIRSQATPNNLPLKNKEAKQISNREIIIPCSRERKVSFLKINW